MAYDSNMSERHEIAAQKQIASTLRIPLPTELRERWRVAGSSHAGTVPFSVGELFKRIITHSQTLVRQLTLLALAALLTLPTPLWATESPQAEQSVGGRSTSVGWYFQSGQWRSDIRTIKAACEFLLNDEPETTTPARGAE
jgi:hypothetical protein